MSVALTPKQEAFAQAVVSGLTISDAYRSAYSTGNMKASTVNREAKSLSDDPKIATRIEALRKPVVEALQYGLKEAMAEAAEALEVARTKENGGAMVAAVTLRAKLSGLIVEKRQNVPNPYEGVPIAELEAMDAALTAIRNASTAADKPSVRAPAR